MTTQAFFREDWLWTLFPMQTERLVIEHAEGAVRNHVRTAILGPGGEHFLSQETVYAAKPGWHLRRTAKLDPAATWYLYDVVYRCRDLFRRPHGANRLHFGYRFEGGSAISGTDAYGRFRETILRWRGQYSHAASFDIASYFNSIYHHDVVSWFERYGAPDRDAQELGRFLREINAGRSVDCLPQGLYPAKMIGNAFLTDVDAAARLRSAAMARFMDDFYLFDDDANVVRDDFLLVQRLLGSRGLNLNPKKTRFGRDQDDVTTLHRTVDEIKVRLLRRRRASIRASAGPFEDAPEPAEPLTDEEREYLLSLLHGDSLDEEDAELVLTLMGEHSEDVLEFLPSIIARFPNLAKRLFFFCDYVQDREGLAEVVRASLRGDAVTTEFQLFWLAWIAEVYLLRTAHGGEILQALFEAGPATTISKSRVLEIPERRWGLGDLREEQLRTAQSGWLTWAAAIGSRAEPPRRRNHLLGYMANASPLNRLVADCVRALPADA